MKLSDNQKVAIYASALQGAIVSAGKNGAFKIEGAAMDALRLGDALIAKLEARNQTNPEEPVTD